MRKISVFLLTIFVILTFYIPNRARAVDQTQAAEVNMAAQVTSPVSKANSSVQLNAQETLADPVNHPLLLTVILLDKDQKPLPDKDVAVTSNRGNVDIIEATSKLSQYQVHAAEVSAMQKDQTNKEGQVSFRITSFIPGQAFLKIMADTIIELPSQTIKFDPLPFPSNLTISVAVPFSQKEWTIFSPRLQKEKLSSLQKEAETLANTGTKIKFNFWAIFFIFALLILSPLFVILNFANLKKLREVEKEEIELLKKIAVSHNLDHLQTEIKRNGYDHDGILDSMAKTSPPK